MRTFFVHVVGVTVALHSLLGCCWHHAHPTTHSEERSAIESSAPIHHCCHHGESEEEPTDHDDSHPSHREPSSPCRQSCGDRCVYVAADRVQVEHPLQVASFDFLPEARPAILLLNFSSARFEATHAAVDPPPLRLHLWYGLLLI